MNEADREHAINVFTHVLDGGQYTHGGSRPRSIDELDPETLAMEPQDYKIIERPMVYVYGVVNNPEKQYAITTHELRGVPIDEQLFGMAKAYTLICSFPIEEQNDG